MQIHDVKTSRPILLNTSTAFVWEVVTFEWCDIAEDYVKKVAAVFFDPWKAVNYGLKHFGAGYIVQQSTRKI